jgi:hypothetical protein
MKPSTIKFSTLPGTEPPPGFVEDVVAVFRQHESEIPNDTNAKGLRSDEVLTVLGTNLAGLGFQVKTPCLPYSPSYPYPTRMPCNSLCSPPALSSP